jgi:FkbM family methyltransferase
VVKKLFFIVSFKEFILICFEKLVNKLTGKSDISSHYLPLYKLIDEYSSKGYRLSTYKRSLLIFGKDNYKTKFLLRTSTSDNKVFNQIIDAKEYYPLIEIIKSRQALDSIETIIDAGANVGFTAFFFRNHFPKAKIFCIEADSANFLQLNMNIKVNHEENNIKVLHRALWYNDNDELFINDEFRDGDSWSKSVSKKSGFESTKKVKSITLNSTMSDNGISKIDILKIDIEGAEVDLFNDDAFVKTLERVRFLAIEIHDELNARNFIENKLSASGFIISQVGETNFCFNKNLS